MNKIAVGLIALVVGLIGGTLVGGGLVGGAMMGAGAGVGLSGGICSTVGAAQELGYLTEEQVDEVLVRAAADLSGNSEIAVGEGVAGSASDCAEVMQRLREQAA